MLTSHNFKAPVLLAASLLLLQASTAAQSGRKPPGPAPTHAPAPARRPEPIDTTSFEKIKLLVSRGLDGFVGDLNQQGRLGYRVEKSVSYGGQGGARKYAAVLRLDTGHTYEYAHDRMPDSELYGHPLDHHARLGYNLVEVYPFAKCPVKNGESGDPYDPENSPTMKMLNTVKSNAFLFMRRDGVPEQTKEYRLLAGRVGLGGNLQETVQPAIDEAPPGFRPVKLLFAGSGLLGSGVSVVLERDLGETAAAKVGYKVIKETKDLVKEVARLAAAGASFVGGGRNGAFKVVLLKQRPAGASDYTFLDDNKAAKGFDKLVAAGYSYQGLMAGDPDCESEEMVSQKLVLAREAAGPTRLYKILTLPEPKRGGQKAPELSELQRLAGEGYQVREIFYAFGLHVILEKQAEGRTFQARPGAL
jgi:hypothetical protein